MYAILKTIAFIADMCVHTCAIVSPRACGQRLNLGVVPKRYLHCFLRKVISGFGITH